MIVVVDGEGRPISTKTITLGQVPPTPVVDNPVQQNYVDPQKQDPPKQDEPKKDDAPKPAKKYPVEAPKQEDPKPIKVEEAPKESPSPKGGSESGSSSGFAPSGNGVSYSPYSNDGNCKKADDVRKDFAKLDGFKMVRIYGTDCEQLKTVPPAAKEKGMKLILGIYNDKVKAGTVGEDVKAIADAVGDDWSQVEAISIGNEPSLNGISVDQAVAAYKTGKTALRGGYQGPVMIAETYAAIKEDPRICKDVDVVAANIHAFFSKVTEAGEAGKLVADEADAVSKKCDGKKVFVTESGWPHQGNTNGKAVPSRENQQKAMSSIKKVCSHLPVIEFTAFNDGWKKGEILKLNYHEGCIVTDGGIDNPSTHNAEKYWGMFD